jgi:hypothetical protein
VNVFNECFEVAERAVGGQAKRDVVVAGVQRNRRWLVTQIEGSPLVLPAQPAMSVAIRKATSRSGTRYP